jgi:hypothetical protein
LGILAHYDQRRPLIPPRVLLLIRVNACARRHPCGADDMTAEMSPDPDVDPRSLLGVHEKPDRHPRSHVRCSSTTRSAASSSSAPSGRSCSRQPVHEPQEARMLIGGRVGERETLDVLRVAPGKD